MFVTETDISVVVWSGFYVSTWQHRTDLFPNTTFIIAACTSTIMTSQNVSCEKGVSVL